MPSMTPDTAMRSHLDSQIAILAELTRKSYDTTRRITELNLELARDLFDDFYGVTRQLLASGDPVQSAALMARQMQPSGERLRSYVQQLGGLLGGAQVDLTRATETLMPEFTRAAQALASSATLRAGSAGMSSARHGGTGSA